MSLFNFMEPEKLTCGLERLKSDLLSKTWEKKYSYLSNIQSYDVGCRFLRLDIKPQ